MRCSGRRRKVFCRITTTARAERAAFFSRAKHVKTVDAAVVFECTMQHPGPDEMTPAEIGAGKRQ
jgi:hypothetical protein